jgi:DNA-binding transcriptional MerR regulator
MTAAMLDLSLGEDRTVPAMKPSPRLLSIGEFAAATQLSAKALRLYDEQHLLSPARVDPSTGYRYYRSDQVLRGRLVRTLRETGLTLAQVASVVDAEPAAARALLGELSMEQDYRHAREKRAFQSAQVMLHRAAQTEGPEISERAERTATVAVAQFIAERATLIERFQAERSALLARLGLPPHSPARCALIDPLSDDSGRMEVVVLLAGAAPAPEGVTVRRMPAGTCAVIAMSGALHASELTAAVDTLFDWFDRHGHRAVDAPWVETHSAGRGLDTQVAWMFARDEE